MIKKTTEVKCLFHARPATYLVNILKNYQAQVFASKDGKTINCHSVLSLMTMDYISQSDMEIYAAGSEEKEAMTAIMDFIKIQNNEGA